MAQLQGWATVASGTNNKVAIQSAGVVTVGSGGYLNAANVYLGAIPSANNVGTATAFSATKTSATTYSFLYNCYLQFYVATADKTVDSQFKISVYTTGVSTDVFAGTSNNISNRLTANTCFSQISTITGNHFDNNNTYIDISVDVTDICQRALIQSGGTTITNFIFILEYVDASSSYLDFSSYSLTIDITKTRTLVSGGTVNPPLVKDWFDSTAWTTTGGTLPQLANGSNVPDCFDLAVALNGTTNPSVTIAQGQVATCKQLNFTNYNNTNGNIVFRIEGQLVVGAYTANNTVGSLANAQTGNSISFVFPVLSNGTQTRTLSIPYDAVNDIGGKISFNWFTNALPNYQTITFNGQTPQYAGSIESPNIIQFNGGKFRFSESTAIFGRTTGTLANNPKLYFWDSNIDFQHYTYYLNSIQAYIGTFKCNNATGTARFNVYKSCSLQYSGRYYPAYQSGSVNIDTTLASPSPYPNIYTFGNNAAVVSNHSINILEYSPSAAAGKAILVKENSSPVFIYGQLDINGVLTNAYQTYTGSTTITNSDLNLNYIQANAIAGTNLLCFIKSDYSITSFSGGWTQVASKSFDDGTHKIYAYVLMKTMQGGSLDNLSIIASNSSAEHLVKFIGNISSSINDIEFTYTKSRAAGEAGTSVDQPNSGFAYMDNVDSLYLFASSAPINRNFEGSSAPDWDGRIYFRNSGPIAQFELNDNGDGTFTEISQYLPQWNTVPEPFHGYPDEWSSDDWASICINLILRPPKLSINTLNIKHTGTATAYYNFSSLTDITINNTMNILGTNNMIYIFSTTVGSYRIWNNTPTTLVQNVNFQDQKFINTIAYNSGSNSRFGDTGGNTNITFDPPSNRYWIGGTGSWSSTAKWSTSSGGATGASVPLPQDTAIFDNNSGTGTVTINVSAVSGISCVSPQALTFTNATNASFLYGDVVLASNSTINNSTLYYILSNRNGQIFDFNGATNNILLFSIDNGTCNTNNINDGQVIIRSTGTNYAFNGLSTSKIDMSSGKVKFEGDIGVGTFNAYSLYLSVTPISINKILYSYEFTTNSNLTLKNHNSLSGGYPIFEIPAVPQIIFNNINLYVTDTTINEKTIIINPDIGIINSLNISAQPLNGSGLGFNTANINNLNITAPNVLSGIFPCKNIKFQNINSVNKVKFTSCILVRLDSGGIWYLPYTELQDCSFTTRNSLSNNSEIPPGVYVYAPNSVDKSSNSATLPSKLFYTKVPYPGVLSLPKAQNPRNQVGIRSNFI